MPEGSLSLYLVLAAICLVLSAFFSGTEAALLSIQRVRLHNLLERGVPGARFVAKMVERPDRFLPTILLGNNLVNTAVAALGTAIALTIIEAEQQAVLIATAVVTVLLLIFGEVIPKTIAARHSERISIIVVRPLEMARYLTFPLVVLLQALSSIVSRLVGGGDGREAVTEEDLRSMISMGRAAGTVETSEAELLERVFSFGDRQVREVQTPRTEVVWVERGTSMGDFLELYQRYPYSRFPVYEGAIDNVVGVLAVKDALSAIADNQLSMRADVTALSRPPFFVPETKSISGLLRELQASGTTMAITVDEFGGVDGVVTLTQLLEVMVGPLVQREGMPSPEEVVVLEDGTFEADGGVILEDANRQMGLALPDGEYETIAGFILDRLGHIPTEGETWEEEGVSLTVSHMRGVKIERVHISKPLSERSANPDEN